MPNERKTRQKPKKLSLLGTVVLIFAVIGVITVAVSAARLVSSAVNRTAMKKEFEEYLLPVLMFDPVPFESVEDADSLMLLQASLWGALLDEKSGNYSYDEMKLLVVPASDVDVAGANLFGPDLRLEHQSFGDYEISYIYNETTKTYHVPVTAKTSVYTPKVEKIEKDRSGYTLTVGYVPPGFNWLFQGDDEEKVPDKYMLYVLKKYDKKYYISAIRDVPAQNPAQPVS